jgi:hypothetical protein
MKRIVRYYFGYIDTQEKWLNRIAEEGYRLVSSGRLIYRFEACSKSEYEYHIEFIGDKSSKDANNYKKLLEELGYRVLSKNINLNYSFGKMKWRPYGSGKGQLSSFPGSYNRELLIIEKKRDGKSFKMYSNYNDLINYYSHIRNMYTTAAIMLLILVVLGRAYSSMLEFMTIWIKITAGIIGGFMAYLAIRYSIQIRKFKKNSNIIE